MKTKRIFGKAILGITFLGCLLILMIILTEIILIPGTAAAEYESFLFDEQLLNGSVDSNQGIYILFEGVSGESQESGHKGWCEVIAFEQEHFQVLSEGIGRPETEVVFNDIKIVKSLDKASPKLAESVCEGRIFPKVEIDVTTFYSNTGNVPYYSYQLGNVKITSYSIGGSKGNEEPIPTEELTISFDQIKVTYTEFDSSGKSKGNIEYSWKVEEGKF